MMTLTRKVTVQLWSAFMPDGSSTEFNVETDKTGDELYEYLFYLQNDNDTDKIVPEYPSMTAGDLLLIDGQYVLCAVFGFREVDAKMAMLWKDLDSWEKNRMAREMSSTYRAG